MGIFKVSGQLTQEGLMFHGKLLEPLVVIHQHKQRCVSLPCCVRTGIWHLEFVQLELFLIISLYVLSFIQFHVVDWNKKSLQTFLLWSLIAKRAGVRTAFEIIEMLISLKFWVPVGWVCVPWVITKAERRMMCVIIYILNVELNFFSPLWVYP